MNHVSVEVFLQEGIGTVPHAEVGLVGLGGDDPVPAKLFEVDCERIATAADLLAVFGTGETHRALGAPFGRVLEEHFQVGHLEKMLKY